MGEALAFTLGVIVMANEVKIDQEQFEQLTDLLETVAGRLDEVASYLERINLSTSGIIDAVKAVENAVEGLPHD
jgi:hypothetical protein